MFKTVVWTDQNVTQLVTGEDISDFDEFAKIDLARAGRSFKVLRTSIGGNPGIAVTEKPNTIYLCVVSSPSKPSACLAPWSAMTLTSKILTNLRLSWLNAR